MCINQDDLDERSSQVSIMCDIYKNATKCQIWLGTVEELEHFPDESPVSVPSWTYLWNQFIDTQEKTYVDEIHENA